MGGAPLLLMLPLLIAWNLLIGGAVTESRTSTSKISELVNPAGPGSLQANLTRASKGRVVLSWLEPRPENTGGGYGLRFSVFDGKAWSRPYDVVASRPFKTSPSVPPAVTFLSDGVAVAWWAQGRPSPGQAAHKHVEDVCVSVSNDGGSTWSTPVIPYSDRSESEHSFASLVPMGENSAKLIWLDGRTRGKQMLIAATINSDGTVGREEILDDDVCACCPTAIVQTPAGPVAAYRNHEADDTRDISIVALRDGRWSESSVLWRDGWKIGGCPINGVDLAAQENVVAAAWYTAANDAPEVRVAFSANAGKTFSAPLKINEGRAVGRSSITLIDNQLALVLWVEGVIDRDDAKSSTQLLLRSVASQGAKGPPVFITKSARGLGYPRIESSGRQVVIAWTDKSQARSVVTALAGMSTGE
jgi:hypothetical protein